MSSDATMMLLVCACGQKMKVSTSSFGKTVRCVKCGERLAVTQDNTRQIATDPVAAGAGATPAGAPREGTSAQPSRAASGSDSTDQPGPIGALLIRHGLITEAQLEEALAAQRERGGKTLELLIELGHLDKTELHAFFSKQPGVASIDLGNYEISSELVALIPKEFALDRVILPIDKLGKLLTVGMVCPIDTVTIKAVEGMTGLRVKAMLCKLDDIHAAVKKYYRDPDTEDTHASLESFGLAKRALKTEDVSPKLAQLDALPASARTLERLKDGGGDLAMTEVAKIVGMDPPFTASILSLANSSAYGFPGRVDTLGVALLLVGVPGVRELTSAAETAAQSAASSQMDLGALEMKSVFCARAAQAIAKVGCPEKAPTAYVAGLLHEIGRYALANMLPDRYAKVDAKLSGAALLKAERQAFNLTHPEAGYSAASRWRLPATLLEPIRRHHEPEKATEAKEIVAVVALASNMAEAALSGVEGSDPFAGSDALLKAVRLDKATAQDIFTDVNAGMPRRS